MSEQFSKTTSSSPAFRCACLQVRAVPDLQTNIAHVLDLLADPQIRDADFVALPEAADLLDPDTARMQAHATHVQVHPFVNALREDSRIRGKWLLIGSVTALNAHGAMVNRSVLIDPHGEIVQEYDKIHLFDAPVNRDNPTPESHLYSAGAVARVVALPWMRIGLTICYDLRFPLLFRALTRGGAMALCVPAAFLQSTGQAHWHPLLRARAIENGCYVIAPAQCGSPHAGRHNYGHSLIVDPWGTVLADGGEHPGVISATIDPAAVSYARTALPVLDHERTFTLSIAD